MNAGDAIVLIGALVFLAFVFWVMVRGDIRDNEIVRRYLDALPRLEVPDEEDQNRSPTMSDPQNSALPWISVKERLPSPESVEAMESKGRFFSLIVWVRNEKTGAGWWEDACYSVRDGFALEAEPEIMHPMSYWPGHTVTHWLDITPPEAS